LPPLTREVRINLTRQHLSGFIWLWKLPKIKDKLKV
jgi:hypothetical protein